MSDELKKRNAALREEIAQMRSQAAAIGIPLSTGGLDLSTGERVPEFKVLGVGFGDATPYEQNYENLLQTKTDLGQQLRAAELERAEVARAERDARIEEILQGRPDTPSIADQVIDIETRLDPLFRRRREEAAATAIRQSQAQMAAVMPYLDEAGRKMIERNLNASQRFLRSKDATASAAQQRLLQSMAGKADIQRATAAQAQAAADMARSGTNRSFGR